MTGGTRFLAQGHPAASAAMERFIRSGRPPHALLLSGPRGVGKTTLALDLAAGLECRADDPAARPCRTCQSCRKVAAGDHPDVHLVAPEGAGDQIRIARVAELTAALSLLPMEGRHRVAVVSAAHRLNPDAQNALLKTLEEPGAGSCIVLCADETAPLLPTVRSRAAHVRLAPLPVDLLTDLLVARGVGPPTQSRALAVAASGRPGIALSLGARPEAMLARARMSRSLLDLLHADRRTRLAAGDALVADGATLDAAMEGTVDPPTTALPAPERRRAVLAVIGAWRDLVRDLAATIALGRRAVRDRDLLEDLEAAAMLVDPVAIRRFADRLDRLSAAIEAYASPGLALDVLLLAWPTARAGGPAARGPAVG